MSHHTVKRGGDAKRSFLSFDALAPTFDQFVLDIAEAEVTWDQPKAIAYVRRLVKFEIANPPLQGRDRGRDSLAIRSIVHVFEGLVRETHRSQISLRIEIGGKRARPTRKSSRRCDKTATSFQHLLCC